MPLLFRTVTLAFGTVAPDGSLTKPEIVPRSDCADSTPETRKHMESARTALPHGFFMSAPPDLQVLKFPRGILWTRQPDARRGPAAVIQEVGQPCGRALSHTSTRDRADGSRDAKASNR